MVKFYLKASAELSNVTDLQPVDTAESPFEYTFTIECTNCREVHEKPVTINRFEQHEIFGSRGEASFVFRCKQCKSEHSANIVTTKQVLTNEQSSGVAILAIDARGVQFNEFIPQGKFQCKALNSKTVFNEVDISDAEWYDYDDEAGEEVSITEVEWTISRS